MLSELEDFLKTSLDITWIEEATNVKIAEHAGFIEVINLPAKYPKDVAIATLVTLSDMLVLNIEGFEIELDIQQP